MNVFKSAIKSKSNKTIDFGNVIVPENIESMDCNSEGAAQLNMMLTEGYIEVNEFDVENQLMVLSEGVNVELLSEGIKDTIKKWYGKMIKFFKELKKKVVQFIKNFINKMASYVLTGKKFVSTYKSQLNSKISDYSDGRFEYNGYKFSKDIKNIESSMVNITETVEGITNSVLEDAFGKLKDNDLPSDFVSEVSTKLEGSTLNKLFDSGKEEIIKACYDGTMEKTVIRPSKDDLKYYMEFVSEKYSDDISTIKDASSAISDLSDEMITNLEKSSSKYPDSQGVKDVLNKTTDVVKKSITIQNSALGSVMGVFKKKQSQYFGAIKAFYRYKPGKPLSESMDIIDTEIEMQII